MFLKSLTVSVFLLFFASPANADDTSAKAKYDRAQALYAERMDLSKIETALILLGEAEMEAEQPDLKYDILVLSSRCLSWKGTHTAGDKHKIVIHELGRQKAELAINIANYADAYYWYATNLGRWGEAMGVLAALGKKQALIDHLTAIFECKTRDDLDGESFEGYGADRILGRLYFKLPPFAGGSIAKALKHLATSFSEAKDYALNVHYYAEALFNSGEKARAREILDDMLKQDPKTYNPARVPETVEEFADAKKLRSEMGN